MNWTKRKLLEMDRCYTVACMELSGQPHVLFATEGRGACVAIDIETLSKQKTIWEEPGGTMGIVPIPGKQDTFLAGQHFFRLFDWEEASLAWVERNQSGGFTAKTILRLPYLHRFDLLTRNGKNYFIGATLAGSKQTRDDWSSPGGIYVGELPMHADAPFEPRVLQSGLTQNHGYERVSWQGEIAGMISCQSGVYVVFPPDKPEGQWSMEQIMTQPVSDIAVIDIDGDGEPEIAAIEPFHGQYFRVYKKVCDRYELVYQHPEISDFYHVASSGYINGEPVFLGGCRRGKQQLFILRWNQLNKRYESHVVDEGVGPSNAIIRQYAGKDIIFSANREKAEAAAYFLS